VIFASRKIDQVAFQSESRHLIADYFCGIWRGSFDGGPHFLEHLLYRFRECGDVLVNGFELFCQRSGSPQRPVRSRRTGPSELIAPPENACSVAAVASEDDFGLVCEVEPATTPDLMRVRHQIGVMSKIASAFLIPDNHIGRATVSSIAVAHEVALMGGRSIACLNARDRNLLGFRRDLLTAAAYDVDEFLFVYGDRPESGTRCMSPA